MTQELGVALAGLAMLLLVCASSSLVVLMGPAKWWDVIAVPLALTLAVFLPAEFPEEAGA